MLPGLEEVLPRRLPRSPAGRYSTCGELIAAARSALGLEPEAHPLALCRSLPPASP